VQLILKGMIEIAASTLRMSGSGHDAEDARAAMTKKIAVLGAAPMTRRSGPI
jgi:hypothetical protein